MKRITTYLVLLYSLCCFAQMDSIEVNKKKLVGEATGNNLKLLVNKSEVIDFINKELFKKEPVIDNVEIKTEYTLGDKKIKYYYIHYSSSKRNVNVVRWLYNIDNKLYLDKSYNEDNPMEQFYIMCEGQADCKPRLFHLDSQLSWSCRELMGCPVVEDNCTTSVSLLD